MIFIKKVLKRVFVFFLAFVLFFNYSFHKNEREAKAIAVADDALVALVITGVALAVGTYAKTSDSSPTDLFVDMFGEDTFDNLKKFMAAVEAAPAEGYLADIQDANITAVALSVKKRYKHPVQMSGAGYLSVDSSGQVLYTESLPYSEGKYYFVDDINDYVDAGSKVQDVSTSSSLKLTKQDVDKLVKAVGAVTKPYVTLGKNILGEIADFVNAVGSDNVYADDSVLSAYSPSIQSRYSDKTAFIADFGNDYYGRPVRFCAAFSGVFLELHYGSDIYFASIDADYLNELNSAYSSSGNISVFTNNMSKNAIVLFNSYYYGDNTENTIYSHANNFSTFYADSNCNDINFMAVNSSGVCNFTGQSAVAFNKKGTFSINRDKVSIVNNGLTGNYVIANVNDDGSISYDCYGVTSDSNYIDGLDTTTVTTKVTGDVNVDADTLDSVSVGTATVDGVNEVVADINSTVKAIDSTISNGFNGILGILSSIKDLILSIPEKIAAAFAAFFSMLWGWLSDILSAIQNIAAPIVAAVNSVIEPIVNAIESIPEAIANISVFQTIIDGLNTIASGIAGIVVSIPQALVDTVETIRDGVLAIPAAIDSIKEYINNLPDSITNSISSMLEKLFIPNNNYFNDWKNKFNNLFHDKLPFETYSSFMEDMQEIESYKLEDITINIYGKTCTVVTFSWYYDNIDTINDWVRGVVFIILIFFNLNQMYKLVRGTSLYRVYLEPESNDDKEN